MIAIFAAMAVEVRACLAAGTGWRERRIGGFPVVDANGILVCQTGLGRPAIEAAEAFLGEISPSVVLSIGTAGGLARDINVGHIVVCERIGHEVEQGFVAGDERLVASALGAARAQGLAASAGSSVTVDTVAWTPEDKAKLHSNGAPDVVEMESFWIGQAAADRGLPFLAARAVSDGPDHDLIEIPDLFDEHGDVKSASVLAFTREHPEAIPLIAAQHESGGKALDSLGRFLAAFLPGLARL